MAGLEELFTTRDLAKRYGREAQAVARMARLGRWPSLMILGQYRFTAEMVAWIDQQHERWPNEDASAAQQPKPRQEPVRQSRQRRTPQPPPAIQPGSNVRRLVAKDSPRRRRTA
jgi:hypothetical protein